MFESWRAASRFKSSLTIGRTSLSSYATTSRINGARSFFSSFFIALLIYGF